MSALEFIAAITGALAWPLMIATVMVVYKREFNKRSQ